MNTTPPQKITLLAAMWAAKGNQDTVLDALESGEIELTGNFRGHEKEIVAQVRN